jgi:hypothetical protein
LDTFSPQTGSVCKDTRGCLMFCHHGASSLVAFATAFIFATLGGVATASGLALETVDMLGVRACVLRARARDDDWCAQVGERSAK